MMESLIRIPNRAEGIAAVLNEPSVHFTQHRPRTGLLMVHSQGGSKTGHKRSFVELGRQLIFMGIFVLRFDLLGEGESEDLLEDPYVQWRGMQPVIDFFCQSVGIQRLIALGDCFGGLLAAYYARLEPRIEQVIIWNIAQMNWTEDLLEGYEGGPAATTGNLGARLWKHLYELPGSGAVITGSRSLLQMARQVLPASSHHTRHRLSGRRDSSQQPVRVTVIHAPSQPNSEQAMATAEFVLGKLEMDAEHVRIPGVPFSQEWKSSAYAVVRDVIAAESNYKGRDEICPARSA